MCDIVSVKRSWSHKVLRSRGHVEPACSPSLEMDGEALIDELSRRERTTVCIHFPGIDWRTLASSTHSSAQESFLHDARFDCLSSVTGTCAVRSLAHWQCQGLSPRWLAGSRELLTKRCHPMYLLSTKKHPATASSRLRTIEKRFT
jgi:hypothetical protein